MVGKVLLGCLFLFLLVGCSSREIVVKRGCPGESFCESVGWNNDTGTLWVNLTGNFSDSNSTYVRGVSP